MTVKGPTTRLSIFGGADNVGQHPRIGRGRP
jgi:hypothetical protein